MILWSFTYNTIYMQAWQFIYCILYKGLTHSWIMVLPEALEISPCRFQGMDASVVLILAAQRHQIPLLRTAGIPVVPVPAHWPTDGYSSLTCTCQSCYLSVNHATRPQIPLVFSKSFSMPDTPAVAKTQDPALLHLMVCAPHNTAWGPRW